MSESQKVTSEIESEVLQLETGERSTKPLSKMEVKKLLECDIGESASPTSERILRRQRPLTDLQK